MDNQKIVLYYCLTSKDLYNKLHLAGLKQDWFTGENRLIYNAIIQYRLKNEKIDEILIANLRIKTEYKIKLSKILDVYEDQYEVYLWEQHLEALRNAYLKRKTKELLKEIDYTPEKIIELSEKLSAIARNHIYDNTNIDNLIDEVIIEIDKRQSGEYNSKYKTGIYSYDRLGYFEEGSLVVIGGESGHGKSRFILNMILRWLDSGHRIVLFSYEMSPKYVLILLAMIENRISWDKLFRKDDERLTQEEIDKLITTIKGFKDKKLIINTTARTFSEMRLIVENHNADIMLIDTINHLIKADQRQDIALGEIARGCKELAENKNILSVIVAQLKDLDRRQKVTVNSRPTDKNLIKESREIRDAADYMDFIYREEEKKAGLVDDIWKGIMEIYRVKGRYVGVGYTILKMDNKTGHIEELSDWELMTIKKELKGV